MKHPIRILLSLVFSLLAGLALAAEYPLSLTDDLGRDITLQAEPMRIVAMLPSHTETLCAINVCDRIVGVDDYSNYPARVNDLPDLGGLRDPNIEKIVALEPDLVLISEDGELAQTLAEFGLTVYAGSAQTYEEVFDKFKTIGKLVNRETEAAVLTGRVQGEIEQIEQLTANSAAPEVYFEIDATPYSVGPESFIGVLIRKAGGDNVVEEGMGDFPQLDPEFIVSADPEIIILADAPFGESSQTISSRPGWSTITAVEEERVYELTQEQVDILNRPGPRIVEAARLFASFFHPNLF